MAASFVELLMGLLACNSQSGLLCIPELGFEDCNALNLMPELSENSLATCSINNRNINAKFNQVL